jgi:general secretion pathway protein G
MGDARIMTGIRPARPQTVRGCLIASRLSGIRRLHRAMTLVEILAVVVILGLLAVTLTVGIAGKMARAKVEIAKTQISQIVSQLQAYQIDKRRLPTASEGLALLTSPAASPNASYYLDPAKLTDPWGNPYLYIVPGPQDQPFEVVSYGSDGQPGGTGDAADISSATMAP